MTADTWAMRARPSSRKRLVYLLGGTPLLALGLVALLTAEKGGLGFVAGGALLVWCGLRGTSL